MVTVSSLAGIVYDSPLCLAFFLPSFHYHQYDHATFNKLSPSFPSVIHVGPKSILNSSFAPERLFNIYKYLVT
jgi:hypothetical protein